MSGPKTAVCCICNQTVNKKQTLETGSGRACRSHPGVEESSRLAQEALELQQRKGRERKPWKRPEPQPEVPIVPTCCCCKKPGMHAQDWFIRILVLGEKYELATGNALNPFDEAETKKAYAELIGLRPLYTKEYKPEMQLSRMGRNVGQFFGFVNLCPVCCTINNIDPLAHMKNITFDQIVNRSAVFEAFVRPSLTEQAQTELDNESQGQNPQSH